MARFNVLPSNPQAWATWDNSASHFVVVQDLKTTSTGSLPAATGTSTTPSTTPPAATTDSDQTQSAPTSPTATDTSTPSESPQSTTLPIAAQAGIGVGIGALAIALAAVAYLLWKLRRSKKALLAEKEQSNNGAGALGYLHAQQYATPGVPLPPGKDPYNQTGLGGQRQELGVNTRYEMDPYSHHTHAYGGRVELSGTPR